MVYVSALSQAIIRLVTQKWPKYVAYTQRLNSILNKLMLCSTE